MFTLQELSVRPLPLSPPSPKPIKLPPPILCPTTNKTNPQSINPQLIPFQDDPAAILDIKEDIRDECSKTGDVTNVVLFDKEPDGVASVRFANAEAARACVRVRPLPFPLLPTPPPPGSPPFCLQISPKANTQAHPR